MAARSRSRRRDRDRRQGPGLLFCAGSADSDRDDERSTHGRRSGSRRRARRAAKGSYFEKFHAHAFSTDASWRVNPASGGDGEMRLRASREKEPSLRTCFGWRMVKVSTHLAFLFSHQDQSRNPASLHGSSLRSNVHVNRAWLCAARGVCRAARVLTFLLALPRSADGRARVVARGLFRAGATAFLWKLGKTDDRRPTAAPLCFCACRCWCLLGAAGAAGVSKVGAKAWDNATWLAFLVPVFLEAP